MRALLRHGGDRRALRAFDARQELVKAGLTRRDLVRMGLVTGGAAAGSGLLIAEKGLAAELRAPNALGALPPMTPFVEPLPVLPALPQRDVAELAPAPTNDPNSAIDPGTGLPLEGRTERHEFEDRFPPQA